jgi:DNA-binding transcriptional LysR family regulator
LRDGSLDFVVAVVVPEHLAPEFDHIELYESRSAIVGRADHPLRHCTSLAELSDAEWLLNPSPESSTQALLDSYAERGLAVPRRVIECPSFIIAHGLLRGSDALAAMPAALLEHPWVSEGLAVFPIADALPAVSVRVVTRRDSPLTPAATVLLECLQHAARSL